MDCPLAFLLSTLILTAPWSTFGQCAPGWSFVGTKCFQCYNQITTTPAAQTRCASIGGHLASLHSAVEDLWITSNCGSRVLIGFNRFASTWDDGSNVNYTQTLMTQLSTDPCVCTKPSVGGIMYWFSIPCNMVDINFPATAVCSSYPVAATTRKPTTIEATSTEGKRSTRDSLSTHISTNKLPSIPHIATELTTNEASLSTSTVVSKTPMATSKSATELTSMVRTATSVFQTMVTRSDVESTVSSVRSTRTTGTPVQSSSLSSAGRTLGVETATSSSTATEDPLTTTNATGKTATPSRAHSTQGDTTSSFMTKLTSKAVITTEHRTTAATSTSAASTSAASTSAASTSAASTSTFIAVPVMIKESYEAFARKRMNEVNQYFADNKDVDSRTYNVTTGVVAMVIMIGWVCFITALDFPRLVQQIKSCNLWPFLQRKCARRNPNRVESKEKANKSTNLLA